MRLEDRHCREALQIHLAGKVRNKNMENLPGCTGTKEMHKRTPCHRPFYHVHLVQVELSTIV